ncbi:hypothetical protein EYC56_17580 [Xanthomonas oryzae]|nr:hypothetical protein EYC56_17580 [Xanthomonas oryzae]
MICSSEKRFFTSNLLRVGNWTPNRCATQTRGDVGRWTMSLAAARQRLDAMRRGEIRPSVKPISFDRAAELSKLGDYLKSIDALALRPESWWSSVMEQFNDGLL